MTPNDISSSQKKIVIIEDDIMLSNILTRHLIDEHLEATLLTSGENAFETLKRDPPAVLVLDIFIPGIKGLDLLELIRKDEVTKHIRVLIVSNTDQVADREKAAALGASFILKAAVTPVFIVEQIKKMLT